MDPQNQPSAQHGQHGQQQSRQMPVYDLSLGGHYGASAAVRLLPSRRRYDTPRTWTLTSLL
jgi:hypothetical protein